MSKLLSKTSRRDKGKRLTAILLCIVILITGLGLDSYTGAAEAAGYTTIYLVDNTEGHWLGNDNAVMELVDNTYHVCCGQSDLERTGTKKYL